MADAKAANEYKKSMGLNRHSLNYVYGVAEMLARAPLSARPSLCDSARERNPGLCTDYCRALDILCGMALADLSRAEVFYLAKVRPVTPAVLAASAWLRVCHSPQGCATSPTASKTAK